MYAHGLRRPLPLFPPAVRAHQEQSDRRRREQGRVLPFQPLIEPLQLQGADGDGGIPAEVHARQGHRHVVGPRPDEHAMHAGGLARAAYASRSLWAKLSYQPPTENTGIRIFANCSRVLIDFQNES